MLQILTYMLAVYLIFKGLEILQIALMSGRGNRVVGLIIGVLAIMVSIGAAGIFVSMADSQARSVSTSMFR